MLFRSRGHTVKDVIEATKKLKNAGFKVGYHIMPGLPYSNPEKDLEKFRELFDNEKFCTDQLKIYPCQIIKDSPLEKIYKIIKYKPYTNEQTEMVVSEMISIIPEYCRIMRIMREIPKEKMVKEPVKLDLRKDVEDKLRSSGIKINEIRMREIGFNKNINLNTKLKIIEYNSSGGKEFFLEFVNKENIIFGLLRLRISKGKAIVRELHVYGQAIKLGEKSKEASQHKGLGKLLLENAEKITIKNNIKKLSIISGVGVRKYYEKLGYNLEEYYMVKYF